jgi:hypothetical protein
MTTVNSEGPADDDEQEQVPDLALLLIEEEFHAAGAGVAFAGSLDALVRAGRDQRVHLEPARPGLRQYATLADLEQALRRQS